MKVGDIIFDFALGKTGIVVGEDWLQPAEEYNYGHSDTDVSWQWMIMYECGELMGADTLDLRVVNDGCRKD